MDFYNSDTFPQWRQKLFIGALKDKEVMVLSVKGNTVTEDDRLLQERGAADPRCTRRTRRLFVRVNRRVRRGITESESLI